MKTLRMNLIYLLHEYSTRGVVYVQILVENSVAYLSDEWNSASLSRRYLNLNGLLAFKRKNYPAPRQAHPATWCSRQSFHQDPRIAESRVFRLLHIQAHLPEAAGTHAIPLSPSPLHIHH